LDDIEFKNLHRAIKKCEIQRLESIVCSHETANSTNRLGWTLLMLAAIEGIVKVGEMLLERGADISKQNKFGENALSCAALSGHTQFVKLLVSHGATNDVRPHGHTLDVWITKHSGLAESKIRTILDIIPPTDTKTKQQTNRGITNG